MSDSPVEWNYLDLADYLIITEAVLGVDAQALVHLADVGLAESALGASLARSYFCGSGGGLTSMPRAFSASGDQPASSP